MIQGDLNPKSRSDPYGRRINREHSRILASSVPYATIILGSFIPSLFVSTTLPMVPPLGFLFLLGWRLMRPGLLPSWVGLPLGAIDDLFSGQPFGSAILLWSLTMLAIEWFEARFPWRGFAQDWLAAIIATSAYIVLAIAVSGAPLSISLALASAPQLLLSLLLYPMIAGMVSWLDRLRLMRIRVIN